MGSVTPKLDLSILCVDDDLTCAKLLQLMLSSRVREVHVTNNGRDAMAMYQRLRPDVVIADVMMPGMSGLQLARTIRELDQATNIILATAFSNPEFLVEAIDLGVNQFVMKPFREKNLMGAVARCHEMIVRERERRGQNERISVLSRALEESPAAVAIIGGQYRIEYVNRKFSELTGWSGSELINADIHTAGESDGWHHIRNAAVAGIEWQAEILFHRKSEEDFWGRARLAPFLCHPDGEKKFIVMIEDITEQKRYERELQYIATHDALTGLVNRGFYEAEMKRLGQGREFPVSIIMADIDGLKEVNDRLGHEAGDKLIQGTARILSESFRAGDVVARIGGDEFAVILLGADADVMVTAVKRTMLQHQWIEHCGERVPLNISVGAATAFNGDEFHVMQTLADESMYRDKLSKKKLRH